MENQPALFASAPIRERVLSIQYSPLRGLHNGLLGAFWQERLPEFRDVAHTGLIEEQAEEFGALPLWPAMRSRLRLSTDAACRLQIRMGGDRLLQLQNGRLILNWIGESSPDYPRFPVLVAELLGYWRDLSSFLAQAGLQAPTPNQWEVTYVNHFPQGQVWQSPADWSELFRRGVVPVVESTEFRLESLEGAWHYEIVPQRGRLHVDLRHGSRDGATEAERLILTLTARGPLQDSSAVEDALMAGLTLGRQAINAAFASVTADSAQRLWRTPHESADDRG